MLRLGEDDWTAWAQAQEGAERPGAGDGEAGEGPLDHAHLARYTLGDPKLEREVLALFIEQAPELLLRLRSARTSAEWRMAAHTLKGSARAIGAWRLARQAEAAERDGGPGQPGDWPAIIEAELASIRGCLTAAS